MKEQSLVYEKNSIILFIISVVGSGLNYLFQIISGRLLTPAQYGDLNTLFSVFNIATVFGTSLALSIATITAGKKQNLLSYVKKISVHTGCFSVVLFIVLLFSCNKIMKFDFATSVVTALSAVIMIFSYVFYGTLQGRKSFISVGIIGFIPSLIKMTIGIALIFLCINVLNMQNPVDAVFVALIISSIISIIYGYKKVKQSEVFSQDCALDELVKKTYMFLKFSLVSSVCLVVFNNIDILIIRNFFDETTVGMYSSALLFGKIILYIPSALVVVMVPTVAENKTDRKVLAKTILYSVGLATVASVGVLILKDFILSFIMGEKYLSATEFVLPICIMIIPLVALTVLINYLLASGKELFVSICSILAIFSILGLVGIFNSSVNLILYTISFVYIALFGVLFFKAIIKDKSRKD